MHPSTFGPYRVVRLIGQGGMGTVYEATDPATGRTVAIKTLPLHLANDDTIRRRFQSEIDALKRLRHPCIVPMLAWGEEEGLPFFVMDYVPGLTLEALLRSGKRFAWQDTVSISQEIVRALKSAHDLGVVHRDLKPANLIFPPAAGGGFHVKLADFGIAKLFGETGLTRSGSVVGTPEYMAPEQAASQHVDRRGDLYSLGLVMFAMLAGKPPFHGAVADVLESQRSREPPRITTLVRDVPKPLADLIERLLEKSPGRRPNNATIVARMLADVASAASKPSEQFAPSTAMPEVPDGLPTTIVTDAAGNTVKSGGYAAKASDTSSRGGPSTFTTREEDALAARIERERESHAHWPRSLLMTAMALAIIASVLAGGWFVGKQVFFPSADAVHARIIQIAWNPNDRELSGSLPGRPTRRRPSSDRPRDRPRSAPEEDASQHPETQARAPRKTQRGRQASGLIPGGPPTLACAKRSRGRFEGIPWPHRGTRQQWATRECVTLRRHGKPGSSRVA